MKLAIYALALSVLLPQTIAPEAKKYLDVALDMIQKNSAKRDADWDAMRKAAYDKAQNATTAPDTYEGIRAALTAVGDPGTQLIEPPIMPAFESGSVRHPGVVIVDGWVVRVVDRSPAAKAGLKPGMRVLSINGHNDVNRYMRQIALASQSDKITFIASEGRRPQAFEVSPGRVNLSQAPTGRMIKNKYAYIEIPAFSGSNDAAVKYADKLQGLLSSFDGRGGLKGWIIDLRLTSGDNMYPIIAGLGPLLGDRDLGEFVRESSRTKWGYRDGKAYEGSQAIVTIAKPRALKHTGIPIVVLTDLYTAGSGEALAVSFHGASTAIFIGQPTAGILSADPAHRLSDGAVLSFNEAGEADRTGKVYRGRIVPDILITSNWRMYGTDKEPAVKEAVTWLDGLARGQ